MPPLLCRAVVRSVFDGVLILLQNNIGKAVAAEVNISKKQFEFIAPSWANSTALLGDSSFLKYILDFVRGWGGRGGCPVAS